MGRRTASTSPGPGRGQTSTPTRSSWRAGTTTRTRSSRPHERLAAERGPPLGLGPARLRPRPAARRAGRPDAGPGVVRAAARPARDTSLRYDRARVNFAYGQTLRRAGQAARGRRGDRHRPRDCTRRSAPRRTSPAATVSSRPAGCTQPSMRRPGGRGADPAGGGRVRAGRAGAVQPRGRRRAVRLDRRPCSTTSPASTRSSGASGRASWPLCGAAGPGQVRPRGRSTSDSSHAGAGTRLSVSGAPVLAATSAVVTPGASSTSANPPRDVEDAQVGDHPGDHAAAGERQRARRDQLGAHRISVRWSISTMTRPAPLTRSIAPPMPLTIAPGTIQLARSPFADDLHAAEHGDVDVAAADHREAGGGVEVRGPGEYRTPSACRR